MAVDTATMTETTKRQRNSKNGTPEERAAKAVQRVPGKRGRQPLVYNVTIGKTQYENVRPARVADFGEELVLPGAVPAALKKSNSVIFVDADGKRYIPGGWILTPAPEDAEGETVNLTLSRS